MKSGVLVRAKTSDGRWANVDVCYLDDQSFRAFVAIKLCRAGAVIGLIEEMEKVELSTTLTRAQIESGDEPSKPSHERD